jgi:hypothetical protein
VSERFRRFQLRSARCWIKTRQQADRTSDRRCEQRDRRIQYGAPDLESGDNNHNEDTNTGPDNAPDHAHRCALEKELRSDMPSHSADCATKADFARSLHHPDQRDVGDAQGPDDQRQPPNRRNTTFRSV